MPPRQLPHGGHGWQQPPQVEALCSLPHGGTKCQCEERQGTDTHQWGWFLQSTPPAHPIISGKYADTDAGIQVSHAQVSMC